MVIVREARVNEDELRRLMSFSVSSRMASSTFSAHIARRIESDMQYFKASSLKMNGVSATDSCHSFSFWRLSSLRADRGE